MLLNEFCKKSYEKSNTLIAIFDRIDNYYKKQKSLLE